jgi:uncharacterized protein (DUF433 family)
MLSDELKYKERIAKDPAVMVGQPVIRGTRIPVELILDWLSVDPHDDEIYEAYPEITVEDVRAAILFARDAVRANYRKSPERKDALAASRRRRAQFAHTNA